MELIICWLEQTSQNWRQTSSNFLVYCDVQMGLDQIESIYMVYNDRPVQLFICF